MSNSSVKFLGVRNFEVDLDRQCKISVEYVVDKCVSVSHNDWIGIFPHGIDLWNTLNLIDRMITYEFVLSGPIKRDERRYKVNFSLKGAKKLKYGQKYQFVYISKTSDIYGVSEIFEFRTPVLNEMSDTTSTTHESDDTGKENTDDSTRVINRKRKVKRQTQPLLKVESEKSESEDKGGSGDQNSNQAKKFVWKFKKNKQVFMRKTETCPNSCCGIHRMSPPISCSNCHRVAGLLRAQEELYNKIKSLAEMNCDLRSQVSHLQRREELSQAAYQKLSVILMRERQAKQFYQAAALERAELEYQIMVVPNVFVPTSRDPPVPCRQRGEGRTSGCSLLKLKAVIGSQEEKIRMLVKEIEQLKMERTVAEAKVEDVNP